MSKVTSQTQQSSEYHDIKRKTSFIKKSRKKHQIWDSLDWFAEPVQMFNFEGRSKIYTVPGVMWSLFLYVAIIALVVDRTASFLNRSSTVTSIEDLQHWNTDRHGFNWTDKNFTMAVGVQNYLTKEFKSNMSHVEWLLHMQEGNGTHESTKQIVGMHKCTSHDWQHFHKPFMSNKAAFDYLKASNEMFCLDARD